MAMILPPEPTPPAPDFAAIRERIDAFQQTREDAAAMVAWGEYALAMLSEIQQDCYSWDSVRIMEDENGDLIAQPVYPNYATLIRCGLCWPCRAHAFAPLPPDANPVLYLEGGR